MTHAAIRDTPLDADAARAAVTSPRTGACVLFEGIVRDHDGGRAVTSLAYTAHPSAQQAIERVAAAIAAEHGVAVWVEHRIGDLAIGDAALVAACASAHRARAFTACAALVDRVKDEVPIWKHQLFADGSRSWPGLDGEGCCGTGAR